MSVDRKKFEINKKIKLLKLAKKLNNTSKACEILGYSRDSFYRFKKLYEQGGRDALANTIRKKPLLKNRILPKLEAEIIALSISNPTFGQKRIAKILNDQHVKISPSGVRSIWLRNKIETIKKRKNLALRINGKKNDKI